MNDPRESMEGASLLGSSPGRYSMFRNGWPLEPGAMCYMMSKEQYLTDEGHHNWIAHLMFFTPLMDGAVWGADLPNSPVMLNPLFGGAPEPIDVFMIPAGRWSDGTADPVRIR
jgi:hypothetical protein